MAAGAFAREQGWTGTDTLACSEKTVCILRAVICGEGGLKPGGEGGIRTPGGVTHARFPGVCLKPLSHLSNRLTATTYVVFGNPILTI